MGHLGGPLGLKMTVQVLKRFNVENCCDSSHEDLCLISTPGEYLDSSKHALIFKNIAVSCPGLPGAP